MWKMWQMKMLGIVLLTSYALGITSCGQVQGGPGAGANPRGGTGSAGSIPSTVVLIGANGFRATSVTLAAGHGLDFVNLPEGSRRTICLGQQGACDSHASGPSALSTGGALLRNNESLTIAFDTPGTYHITTTPMPVHDLTVVVH